jgi:hypothetical protein
VGLVEAVLPSCLSGVSWSFDGLCAEDAGDDERDFENACFRVSIFEDT